MRFSRQLTSALLGALPALAAVHMEVEEDISFGQHGSIWTSDHNQVVGYETTGENGYHPAVLSDRVVLTNMHVGNVRASMWSEFTQRDEEWAGSLNFRVTGPEHGTGNLQFWYVKDKLAVKTASIYSVGKFDGLAIAIDQTGGQGGQIRAFLNDGSTAYKDHHDVDNLAFGRCNFAYRNLGRWLHMEIRQSKHKFELDIDHQKCIHTSKVHVPANYHFGVTAATNDNPDEIEIHSVIIQSPTHHEYHHDDHHYGSHEPHHDEHDYHGEAPQHSYYKEHHDTHDPRDQYHDKDWAWTEEKDRQRDHSADEYKTESSRFADLHDRVQYLTHQLDMVFHDISVMKEIHEERHKELISWLSPVHDYTQGAKLLLDRMETVVDAIRSDVETKEFRTHLEELHTLIGHSHASLLEHLPNAVHNVVQTHSPRFGFFVFIIIASQVMLLGSYMVYRRRRDMQPKKFL